MSLNNLKIVQRMALGCGTVLLLQCAIVAASWFAMSQTDRASGELDQARLMLLLLAGAGLAAGDAMARGGTPAVTPASYAPLPLPTPTLV